MRPTLIAIVLIVLGMATCCLLVDSVQFSLALMKDEPWATHLRDMGFDLVPLILYWWTYPGPPERNPT